MLAYGNEVSNHRRVLFAFQHCINGALITKPLQNCSVQARILIR